MSIRERAYKRNCLIATSALPLAYLNMPKAACSTIKNILYYLETGSWFSDPLGIHRHIQQGSTLLSGSALARHLDQNTLQRPYITFTFVRHPGKRAYSGFINKIWFIHPYSFPRIRCFLQDSRSMVVADSTDEASLPVVRSAFSLFLDFVLDNLAGKTPFSPNDHWASQYSTLRNFGPADYISFVGRVETFRQDMTDLLSMASYTEDTAGLVDKRFNEGATPPFVYEEVLDAAIAEKLLTIYKSDYLAFGYKA